MSSSFCELCGRPATDGKRSVLIDNTVFNVCMACSKRGKPYVPPSIGKRKTASTTFSSRVKPQRIQLTDDTVLNPEFANLIREARIKLGLSHEQLRCKNEREGNFVEKTRNRSIKA